MSGIIGQPQAGPDEPEPNAEELVTLAELTTRWYAAFEAGDIDTLTALWDDSDDLVCVHPGWPMLHGRGQVLRSCSLIMANTSYLQFFLTDVMAAVDGDIGVVTCTENIMTSVEDRAGDARATATNVWRRRPLGWRLWVHHGSPVIAQTDSDEGESV